MSKNQKIMARATQAAIREQAGARSREAAEATGRSLDFVLCEAEAHWRIT